LDLDQLSNESALGPPDVSNELEITWVDLPEFTGLPTGVHDLGTMLPVYPRGPIPALELDGSHSREEVVENFDINAFFTYSGFDPELSLYYFLRGQNLLTVDFNIVRPTFPGSAIPEPLACSLGSDPLE
jgi:hypothetical protein